MGESLLDDGVGNTLVLRAKMSWEEAWELWTAFTASCFA